MGQRQRAVRAGGHGIRTPRALHRMGAGLDACDLAPHLLGYAFEHQCFALAANGLLLIRAGYAWDGPSFPAIDTRDFMRPSLVHDCLYQAAKEGLLPHSERKTFDELLRLHCRADGMFGARAWWVHRAVRTFGGPVMRKPQKVLVAPAPKYRRPLSEYARGAV